MNSPSRWGRSFSSKDESSSTAAAETRRSGLSFRLGLFRSVATASDGRTKCELAQCSVNTLVVHFDCHPAQAFFVRRRIWPICAKLHALSLPKGRVLCEAIIARLYRFLIKMHPYLNTANRSKEWLAQKMRVHGCTGGPRVRSLYFPDCKLGNLFGVGVTLSWP